MSDATELARIVLEWAKADAKIADSGWDGGEADSNWDNLRGKMIDKAKSILQRKE